MCIFKLYSEYEIKIFIVATFDGITSKMKGGEDIPENSKMTLLQMG